jgi:oligo-1,6-glucosidase
MTVAPTAPSSGTPTERQWWKTSVVYQIYPRSFCDSNGDGIGDLPGILSKLDYLVELGVDVVWLSPFYQSPNDDNGYDISDYRKIMTEFGTMADFDELLAAMHARGLKLVMDLVVNHCSDEHQWFVEACRSKDNPYREYFMWQPPAANGGPPTNWEAAFSGSAWELHEPTGEYYLHSFSKKQPDLNWPNPKVRTEVFELMRFWLDKGVDGFRMDVINMISKTPGWPQAKVVKPGPWQPCWQFIVNGPRLLEYLGEMRREVLSHYDILTVGETPGVNPSHGIAMTDAVDGPLNMIFQFEHMDVDGRGSKWNVVPFDLVKFKQIMTRWQDGLAGRGWNSLYLANHDQPRPVSRFGNDGEYRERSAKMLATMLHFQQGTPYVYQGEELGMTNVRFASIDAYRDLETLNMYAEAVGTFGKDPEDVMSAVYVKSRDNARTPVQWTAEAHGGFTTGTPWIAANPNYRTINAAAATADPDSVFHYYRRLIALRRLRLHPHPR